MVFSKASQIPTCNINVNGKILEQVHSFVYLGMYIHEQSVDIKGYNNNNCLKSNIQCIEIRVQWTVHLYI